jgi:hypothetical protein
LQGAFSAPTMSQSRNCRRLFAPMDFSRSGDNVGRTAARYHFTDTPPRDVSAVDTEKDLARKQGLLCWVILPCWINSQVFP